MLDSDSYMDLLYGGITVLIQINWLLLKPVDLDLVFKRGQCTYKAKNSSSDNVINLIRNQNWPNLTV